jgi:hypothetical protein
VASFLPLFIDVLLSQWHRTFLLFLPIFPTEFGKMPLSELKYTLLTLNQHLKNQMDPSPQHLQFKSRPVLGKCAKAQLLDPQAV